MRSQIARTTFTMRSHDDVCSAAAMHTEAMISTAPAPPVCPQASGKVIADPPVAVDHP